MKKRRSVCSHLLAVLVFAAAADGAAGSLSECASIAEDQARLACYDALANRPRPLPAPLPVSGAAVATPPPTPTELFGRDTVQSESMALHAVGLERIEEIVARVTGVRLDAYGKLMVTLDNGQVWAQIDSPALNLRSGDEVRIRRAALGSYLLAEVDGKRSGRVRRSQ